MVLRIRGGRHALPIFATSCRRDRKRAPSRGIITATYTHFYPSTPRSLHNDSPQPPVSACYPSRNHPTRTCPEEVRMVGGSYSSSYELEVGAAGYRLRGY
ncbi:hypothetical protein J6590_080657 [Homalodisca vitripennis]|nr:hypothetical protein J6590_080657 [Homalodisca vitripennis]